MFLTFHFRSDSLRMETSANIILPENARSGAPCRTVYLLHGLKGDHNSWMPTAASPRFSMRSARSMPTPSRRAITAGAGGMRTSPGR